MKRYPAYKDSGVEWLGEVPEGWEVKRLRHLVQLRTDKATSTENPIALENIEGWSGRIIPTETEFQGEGVAFLAGDILFGKLRPYLAKVALADRPGEAVGDFHVMRPAMVVVPRFLHFALLTPTMISVIDGSTYGSKMPRAGWDFMANLAFALPPLPEQQAIAGFLDREVGKIDALVQEQRRLIALLAEKRQAVISHAVTRGLNPNAPLKPSGIDWLGDIPEGWKVFSLKRACANITDGAHISPETDGGVFPFISTKDLGGSEIDFENCLMTSPDTYQYMVLTGCQPQRGDVLFSKDGTIGRTMIVETDVKFVVASSLIIIRPDTNILLPGFLNYLCKSFVVGEQVRSYVKGAGLPRLSITNLLKVIGVFPPLLEQFRIVNMLRAQTSTFDALTAAATSAISLLQERRAALISAAVTGKIDVRDATGSPQDCALPSEMTKEFS